MRKAVILYTENFPDGSLSDNQDRNDVHIRMMAEWWMKSTGVGQWLTEQGIELEIRLINDVENAHIKLNFIARFTEKEHVEYLLRWKN